MNKIPLTNYAFIDGNNLYRGLLDLGWRIDYARFRRYLTEKHHVGVAYLFIGYIDGNEEFYTHLQQQGYVLIFKPTYKDHDGHVKGNIDAELVLQAMLDIETYEQAILVTGDGDFACLARHLLKVEKLRRVLAPNDQKCSSLLRKVATGQIDGLNRLRSKLALTRKEKVPEIILENEAK